MARKQSVREFQEAGATPGVVATTIPTEARAVGQAGRYLAALSLAELFESPMNPRKRFEAAGLEQLTASIREKGVLTPLLARPVPPWAEMPADLDRKYEIAAGHRRYRAAKAAGLEAVPVVLREMSDTELLEVLVIENDQREDVHPLEEADGYRRLLMPGTGYDVAKVAARIGRSVKYVYDRVKLLSLTKEAQRLFLDGRFTAGHAILLARLKAEDQKRAIDPEDAGFHSALFTDERGLFDWREEEAATKRDPHAGLKAVTVREFEAWIDEHIKVDRAAIDPVLFPETATLIGEAHEKGEKVIPIMSLAQTPEAARGKERIYTESSWKRADGLKGSKACDRSILGVVSIGPGRHEAFRVCTAKETCAVHWAKEQRERKQRQAQLAKGGAPAQRARQSQDEQNRKYREEQARKEEERKRWEKARPAILAAVAAAVKKAPARAKGALADLVLRGLENYQARSKDVEKLVPRGSTAEDLVRHAAFIVVASQYEPRGWRAAEEVPKIARAFGVDVRKILDQAAPEKVQTAAKAAPAKKGGKS